MLWICAHVDERQYHDGIAYHTLGGGRRGAARSYRGDQPIASFRDGLDDAWFAGIVVKSAAQLSDAALQYILGHDGPGPHGLKKLLFGNRVARVLG